MDRKKLGIGCAAVVLVGVVGIFVMVVSIFLFVMTIMKSNDVFAHAMERTRSSPAVAEIIGSPVEDGLLARGNISTSGPSGEADLSIPVTGPHGEGVVNVVATKRAGNWTYETLTFESGGRFVNLIEPIRPEATE